MHDHGNRFATLMGHTLYPDAEAARRVAGPETAARGGPVVVLGIGNTLLTDDGVGVHAIHYLGGQISTSAREGVELVDGGTLSFTLAGYIDDARGLIVVDAARFDAAPGTVRVLAGSEMDRFLGRRARHSVHEVSLADLLDIARLHGTFPRRRALVGVEPARTDWGETLSAPLARALPEVADAIVRLVDRWRR